MDAAKGKNMIIIIITLGFLSTPCICAHRIKCTVTQNGGETLYSVPEFNASSCRYWWTNGSGHVLAHDRDKLGELVLNNTKRSIITKPCFEKILYGRSCISEGIEMEANCTTSCSGNTKHQDWNGTTHNLRYILISAGVLFTLLMILLCFRKRQRLRRWMMQNLRPSAAEEEEQ